MKIDVNWNIPAVLLIRLLAENRLTDKDAHSIFNWLKSQYGNHKLTNEQIEISFEEFKQRAILRGAWEFQPHEVEYKIHQLFNTRI